MGAGAGRLWVPARRAVGHPAREPEPTTRCAGHGAGDTLAPMRDRLATGDRAYCRAVLPRVSRTFTINIRLLGGAMGEAVRVVYLLCRTADALEDSWPGDATAITERFGLLLEALSGEPRPAEELARRAAALASG